MPGGQGVQVAQDLQQVRSLPLMLVVAFKLLEGMALAKCWSGSSGDCLWCWWLCLMRMATFWVPGTEAVNAFSQDWSSSVHLLVPPFCLLLHVLHHLMESHALVVLVFPVWEVQPWWPVLLWVTVWYLDLGEGQVVVHVGPLGYCKLAKYRER